MSDLGPWKEWSSGEKIPVRAGDLRDTAAATASSGIIVARSIKVAGNKILLGLIILAITLFLVSPADADTAAALEALNRAKVEIEAAENELNELIRPESESEPESSEALGRHEIRFNGDGTATASAYIAALERGELGSGARSNWSKGKAANPETLKNPYSCLLFEQSIDRKPRRWVLLRTDDPKIYKVPTFAGRADFKIRLRPFHTYLKNVRPAGTLNIQASQFLNDRNHRIRHSAPKGW